jgi:hypothetical protein
MSELNPQILKFYFFSDVVSMSLILKVSFKWVKLELLFTITVKISLNTLLSIYKFLLTFFTVKTDQNHCLIDLKILVFSFLDLWIAWKYIDEWNFFKWWRFDSDKCRIAEKQNKIILLERYFFRTIKIFFWVHSKRKLFQQKIVLTTNKT